MLRRKSGATSSLDEVDQQLLRGVDLGLRWSALLQMASCEPDEAGMRILRMIRQGHLEGTPGDAHESAPPTANSIHTAITQPPPSAARFGHAPTARMSRTGSSPTPAAPQRATTSPPAAPAEPRSPSAPTSSTPPGKTLPPSAVAAREALLRELAMRRSGTSFPPAAAPHRASEPASTGGSLPPGYYNFRPSSAYPGGSSVPPPGSNRPLDPRREPVTSAPPGRYSVTSGDFPGASSSAPPGAGSVDSPLTALIQELAGGADLQRWCAAQLRDALEQDLSGQVEQALATVQAVMSQFSDPRIRIERDRLQAKSLRAVSGVYRARALRAESASRHEEAAESWRKVLEACPDDVDAVLHAAKCSMESGDIRQAGVHARRAVELSPTSVAAHKLMLRFFRKTGMERNADRERQILRKLAKG
jgi:hypothetical protein